MVKEISKSLLEKLASYDSSHEQFEEVRELLLADIGEDWHTEAQGLLESLDIPNKEIILENISQVTNYDGALSAWEEGHNLIDNKDSVTAEYLHERLPAIEYWLSFFEGGGEDLVKELKELLATKDNEISQLQSDTENEEKLATNPEEIIEKPEFDTNDFVQEDSSDTVEVSPIEEKTSPIEDEVSPVYEEISPVIEASPVEEEIPSIDAEKPSAYEEISPVIEESSVEEEKPEEDIVSETIEILENPVSIENLNISESFDQETIKDEIITKDEPEIKTDTDNSLTEDLNENEEILSKDEEQPIINEALTNNTKPKASQTGLEAIELEKPLESSNPNHWEWYINRFLRLNDYYDQTISRTSARCVELGGIVLSDYPYFEYILDVLSEVIDMGKQIIAKPAVHSLVKDRIPNGIKGLEKIISAYELDFNANAPPEMVDKSSNMEMVKARLGVLAENIVETDIGPAPDGFVVEDEPSVSFS